MHVLIIDQMFKLPMGQLMLEYNFVTYNGRIRVKHSFAIGLFLIIELIYKWKTKGKHTIK